MRLLKYEGFKLTFEPELLTIKVFKKLHQRDKTKDKSKFLQELGYIYFFVDPRSDFQIYTDEEERHKKILEGIGVSDTWKIDKDLQEAIDYYAKFKPISALLLDDTRAMINGYRSKLRALTATMADLDVKETKDVGGIIKQIPALVKDLDEAEKAVTKEIVSNDRVRGNVEKSMYEDLVL